MPQLDSYLALQENIFVFSSLLFVFGLASANIWYQMLLTEKRKNYAVLVGQQQLYQKMV